MGSAQSDTWLVLRKTNQLDLMLYAVPLVSNKAVWLNMILGYSGAKLTSLA